MPRKYKGREWKTGVVSPGPTSSYNLNVSVNTVAYTNTTDKTMFTIPANANIAAIQVDVNTAFNDSGTDVLDVGKSGTTTHFRNDLSVTATGQTITGWSNLGDVGTSDISVVALYAGQTGDATAGQATLYMFWYTDK